MIIMDDTQKKIREELKALQNSKVATTSDKTLAYHDSRVGQVRPEHAEKMKGQMTGINNPMHGKEPWNKGLDKTDPRVLAYSTDTAYKGQPGNQHAKGNIGKKQDEEWKRKRLDKIKGAHEVSTCPHCGKEGGVRSMKRWHFDNCKMKDSK
jgi:hypothetical protein